MIKIFWEEINVKINSRRSRLPNIMKEIELIIKFSFPFFFPYQKKVHKKVLPCLHRNRLFPMSYLLCQKI